MATKALYSRSRGPDGSHAAVGPLFEADFDADSYGFRPKRAAHDALDAIHEALEGGMYWVIDADVTAYFDTIPHDRLMKTVAQRVVD